MFNALHDTTYRRLFSAQVMSLLGTGLMTVALALLAFDLSGADAGIILGTVFTLKMIAYVGFAPIANALSERLPVKHLLVGLDLGRLLLTCLMPLVDAVWQVFLLVFLFQLCSASFTPAFQSLIPDIVQDERRYAGALALSRLAYNLETMLSPLLAGLLLLALSTTHLFWAASACFCVSAFIVLSARLPERMSATEAQSFLEKLGKGFKIYVRTPRLRGLLAVNLALSLSIAWVLVNSVVYAGVRLEVDPRAYTHLMTAYGFGAIALALCVPYLVSRWSERSVLLFGAFLLGLLPMLIVFPLSYLAALALWTALGGAASLVLTPGGLVLARSAQPLDRPALYAAHFSLSHAGWLIAYPLAGWLGTFATLEFAFVILAGGTIVLSIMAWRLWPTDDPIERLHTHHDLEHTHGSRDDDHHGAGHVVPLGSDRHRHAGLTHKHAFHIDDHHPVWDM